MIGHRGVLARPRRLGARNGGEPLLDRRLHLRWIEIADGDDRHEVGAIPVAIELHGETVREALEVFLRPDRHAQGVLRPLQHHGELAVLHARGRVASGAPLLDDDAAFLLHFGRVERRRAARPVLQDVERRVHQSRRVRRNREHVDGFIERRVRVQVRAESHAHALEVVHDVLLGEPFRAVEHHVLDEMREPPLGVVLENRARVHHQPQLRAFLGLQVAADDVVKAVRELAPHHVGVGGERSAQVLRVRRGGESGDCEDGQETMHGHGGDERWAKTS